MLSFDCTATAAFSRARAGWAFSERGSVGGGCGGGCGGGGGGGVSRDSHFRLFHFSHFRLFHFSPATARVRSNTIFTRASHSGCDSSTPP